MATTQRFNGLSFTFDLGDFKVKAKKFTLDITDNSGAAKRNGRPDGFLLGDVSASGTITVDRIGLRAFVEAGKSAGAIQEIPPFDINSYAEAAGGACLQLFNGVFGAHNPKFLERGVTSSTDAGCLPGQGSCR